MAKDVGAAARGRSLARKTRPDQSASGGETSLGRFTSSCLYNLGTPAATEASDASRDQLYSLASRQSCDGPGVSGHRSRAASRAKAFGSAWPVFLPATIGN